MKGEENMKKLLVAATALSILSIGPALAEDEAPVMDIEIVTQNATEDPSQAGMLVPFLMMTFMVLTAN